MQDRLHRKIDVEFRPIEMVGLRSLDVQDGGDGSIPEPGKPLER
jgi:hypothetical protein